MPVEPMPVLPVIKIAIVGAAASGKSTFIDSVLFPALLKQRRGFIIREGGITTAVRGGEHPYLEIQTFTDPQMAAKFLGAPSTSTGKCDAVAGDGENRSWCVLGLGHKGDHKWETAWVTP